MRNLAIDKVFLMVISLLIHYSSCFSLLTTH